MRPTSGDLQQLGPFAAGVNNLSRETSVPRKALREAVNVVLSDDGKACRRDGYTLVEPLDAPISLFGYGNRGFLLEGTTLTGFELLDGAPAGFDALITGLRRDALLARAMIEPYIFVSDGDRNFRIAPDNTVTTWTSPTAQEPQLASVTGAGMEAGAYRFALCCIAPDGTEGPASQRVTLELADGDLPMLTLPALPDGANRYALYMTKPNGTKLLRVGEMPAGVVTVTSLQLGRPCVTEHRQALPPGRHALYYRSRLWIASDNFLCASEPFQYGLTQLDFNIMTFSETITGLGAAGEVGGGFFVGQKSRTYFVTGESPEQLALSEKYPAGMVDGTLTMVPGARLPMQQPPTEPVPMWLATNGVVCVGLPTGDVMPLTETSYAADVGETGAGLFMQRDGTSRFIATTRDPSDNAFAVQDDVAFEIIRNGIPVTV